MNIKTLALLPLLSFLPLYGTELARGEHGREGGERHSEEQFDERNLYDKEHPFPSESYRREYYYGDPGYIVPDDDNSDQNVDQNKQY